MFWLHAFREIADVARETASLLGECRLSFGELRLPRTSLGRSLHVALPRDELRNPPQKLPHLLLVARQPLVGIPRLQQREQFAEFVERGRLAAARLEQLALLQKLHDHVEAVAHLSIPRLFEHAPQQRGPPWIAGGQQVGQPEERLFEVAKLLRQLLLAGGQAAPHRFRGRLFHGAYHPTPSADQREKAQRNPQPAPPHNEGGLPEHRSQHLGASAEKPHHHRQRSHRAAQRTKRVRGARPSRHQRGGRGKKPLMESC